MKIYEIIDEREDRFIGILLYYERSRTFIVELADNLDEWTAPMHFMGFVKKGIFTIPRQDSLLWVRARIVPPERQNISDILNRYHLKEYDEMKLLEISEGRCAQDALCIRKTDTLPEYVKVRMKKNLFDCVMCEDHRVLCFFADDRIKITALETLHVKDVDKVLKNDALYGSGMISPGGYSLAFNDSMDIPAIILYDSGEEIPLKSGDFIRFIKSNVPDTARCCDILGCSRQNLSYIVKKKDIRPIKEVKGTLYLKGDILKSSW